MRPPAGLGNRGRALWSSIAKALPEGWELDDRELAILTMAARQAAAQDLATIGMVEGLREGIAYFRREDAAFVDWANPKFECDHGGSIYEFAVPVPWLSVDTVMPEIDRENNLERCRLAIRHGTEKADLDLDLMRRSIEESDRRHGEED